MPIFKFEIVQQSNFFIYSLRFEFVWKKKCMQFLNLLLIPHRPNGTFSQTCSLFSFETDICLRFFYAHFRLFETYPDWFDSFRLRWASSDLFKTFQRLYKTLVDRFKTTCLSGSFRLLIERTIVSRSLNKASINLKTS